MRVDKKLVLMCITAAVIIAFITASVLVLKDLPSPTRLQESGTIPYSTHIYDRKGKLLYEVYRDQNRTPVTLASLPGYVYNATIAVEDKNFYKHGGVSVWGGVVRAFKENITGGGNLQGGSTITQQLVKSALLSPERTLQRKIKEMILALLVEQRYSKDQILEMYINQVPYGGTAWGIEQASQLYFRKSAKKLTVAQAAFLAGLPQAPSLYSPYSNPHAAQRRQQEVLRLMYEQKYITKKQYDDARREKLKFEKPQQKILAPHFVFYVRDLLEKEYGARRVQEGGLRVYTSLDYDLQEKAQEIVSTELESLEGYNVGNGAALVTRPPTGEVLAMVGSRDYFDGGYGAYNVTTALRQPGSSIKPLNYAVGIERRIVSPGTIFLDVPTCFGVPGQKNYCPKNYDGTFHGPVSLRFALANSYNIPAVKMLAKNGLREFVASASAFGISTFKNPDNYGLSLTLGGGEVKMTDMAKAFSMFPNQGVNKDLVSVLKVTTRDGKVIYEYKDRNLVKDPLTKPLDYPNALYIAGKRTISKETAFLISHILLDNNARSPAFGTSSYLRVPSHSAVSVKTGTTDDLKDNWTIGYTPNFMTLVWVGNNDGKPMRPGITSGVTGAAPIWNKIMQYILRNQPDLWPRKPENVIGSQSCVLGAQQGEEKECQTRFEYSIRGTEVKPLQTGKQAVFVNKDTNKITKPDDPAAESKEKTILRDEFSQYCVDCNNEGATPSLVDPTKRNE